MTEVRNVKCIACFNNKGGVGKTSLVYHLAWMYAELGYNVVAADLDPQANLTSMFFDDETLEALWEKEDSTAATIQASLTPLLAGTGDVLSPYLEEPIPGLRLILGDMRLAQAEDELSSNWPRCLDRQERAFRVLSAIWRILQAAAQEARADLVLMDAGPNLGALNRALLIAADHVVVPLAPDLYSIKGLHNLGPALRVWKEEWQERLHRNPVQGLHIPDGAMEPVGYVVLQHAVRLDRPVAAYERWMRRIPEAYHRCVLNEDPVEADLTVASDPCCLGALKHYRSLMPLAQEARKPMFALKAADGAIGSHSRSAQHAYKDFKGLALEVARRCGISPPADAPRYSPDTGAA